MADRVLEVTAYFSYISSGKPSGGIWKWLDMEGDR